MKFSILKRVMSYCKPYNRFFIAAIVSAVIQISLTLYGPILVGQAVDYMIGYRNVDHITILQTICILSATIVVSTVFQWIMAYCIHKLTYLTTQDMRVQTYQKLNTMPLKYLDGHAHGDIISRLVNDVDQVADGLLQGFTQFFTGIVTIVGTIIFMLTISPLITLVVVLITPLSIFVAAFIAKLSHKMFVKQQAIQGQLSGHVEELVGNQRTAAHLWTKGTVLFRFVQSVHTVCKQSCVCRRCSRGFRLCYHRRSRFHIHRRYYLVFNVCQPIHKTV